MKETIDSVTVFGEINALVILWSLNKREGANEFAEVGGGVESEGTEAGGAPLRDQVNCVTVGGVVKAEIEPGGVIGVGERTLERRAKAVSEFEGGADTAGADS